MAITTLDPLFVMTPVGCLALVALALRLFPSLWAATVGEVDRGRNHSLDGARGLLTLWVLTHHLNALPEVLGGRSGLLSHSTVLTDMMVTGFFIAPFFVLTAMLFGGRLLQTKGKLDTLAFLQRRAFRLLPVYLFSIALIFITALGMTGFVPQVGAFQLLKDLARWCLVDFVPRWGINGVDVSGAHGMLWTLRLEVIFYASVPILAALQRFTRSPVPLFASFMTAALYDSIFFFFLAGLVAAVALGWSQARFRHWWQAGAIAAVALLIATAHLHSRAIQAALIIPIMVALVQEAALFMPLRWRPIRWVGEISYSVYVLHYPLIWMVYTLVVAPDWVVAQPYGTRLLIDVAIGAVVLAVSTFVYVAIERPGVRLGQRLRPGSVGFQFRTMLWRWRRAA